MAEIENAFASCRNTLAERLAEPAPGRIQILTGPRQVGKTTLLLELVKTLGDQAIYAAGDDPDATLPGYWERCWENAERRAQQGTTLLLLDEVHSIPDWAAKLKGAWDRLRRRKIPIHVVATGSSALRVATGSRESLAGRFERMTLSHWPAISLAESFGFSAEKAARDLIRFGSYPGAVAFQKQPARWRSYVRESIIEPAIGRDMLALGNVRKPALLRQIFAVAVGTPAQIISLQKLQGQLQDGGALETVAHYLALLQDAYLIAPLEKYATQIARRRAAPPKIVVLNNALLSAMHPDGAPDQKQDPSRFGQWVENACMAFAVNQNQQVTYWREEPIEVDGVFEGSWGKWAVEIKTGRFTASDLRGLLEFCRRFPAFHPLVITAPGDEENARKHGISAVSWIDFLVAGPPVS